MIQESQWKGKKKNNHNHISSPNSEKAAAIQDQQKHTK